MLTPAGAINWVSPSFTRSSGRTLNDLEAHPAAELRTDDRDEMTRGLARSSEEAALLAVRLRVAGEWRWSELSWRLVSEPDSGAPDEIVLSIRDVHDERLRNDQLTRQALTDPLTGVANREGLDRALAALGDCDVVLAFCDIDGFKVVNDVHGHATGDEVFHHDSQRVGRRGSPRRRRRPRRRRPVSSWWSSMPRRPMPTHCRLGC